MEEDDLLRLSIAAGTMGPIRKVFEMLISYERRILSLRKQGK
jgi:hypothetical protein